VKVDFCKSQDMTCNACGVSVHTVSNICCEATYRSLGKKWNAPKCVTNVDVLHGVVFEFYDEGHFPTAKNLTQ
jgi:hypothetical protein